ncbi:helix-turn-helix domain-containing protein, partial [Roseateles sp. BYS96W]
MAMKGKIRAMHLREGKSISEIARRTSLSRNTIKKWLKEPAEAPEFDTKQPFRAFSASGSIWNQQLRRALVDFL